MKFQSQSPPNIITHQLLLSWYPGFIISWSPDLLKYCYPEILFSWTPYNSSLSWPPSSYKSSPCCRKGILISFLAPWSLVTGEVPWPGQAWPWPGLAWPWRGLAWPGPSRRGFPATSCFPTFLSTSCWFIDCKCNKPKSAVKRFYTTSFSRFFFIFLHECKCFQTFNFSGNQSKLEEY